MSDFASRTLRDRLIALGGLLAIVAVLLGALYLGGFFDSSGDAEAAELLDTPIPAGLEDLEIGPKAGELAPDFEISDFDGDRHRLSAFRGQVVYLNFWATWCVPCQAELPDIDRLQSEYGGELAVIEVNRGQSTGTARDFFEGVGTLDGGEGVSFAVDGLDPDETLYERYLTLPIQAMPISVIIDERGVVTELANGQLRYDDMKAAVDAALAAGD
jgi:thiol-disulfide isomerase/thioredoxin